MPIPSPFESVHEMLGANFAEYNGWRMPRDYGDIEAEKTALKSESVSFDLSSFGKITLKGKDSRKILENLIIDSKTPFDEEWTWAKVAAHGSKELNIRIGYINGIYYVFTMPADRQSVLEMIKNAPGDTIIDDITEKTGMLALYGPGAVKAASNILPFGVSDIDEEEMMSVSLLMMQITILRGSWVGCDGLELLCPKSACGMAAAAVAKYRKKEHITPAGMVSLLENIK